MANTLIRHAVLCGSLLAASAAFAETASQEMLAHTCVGCHGPDGNSVGPASPIIAGLSKNYLLGAMLAYKYDDSDKLEDVIDKDPDFEDVAPFARPSTIMGRIAKGYTEEEIKKLADYFAGKKFIPARQETDAGKVKVGAKLHDEYCEKCHEDNGRLAEDDTGVLAGQWVPYLHYAMQDYVSGAREMPKKMRSKVEETQEEHGKDAIDQLVHFYGSQN